MKRKILCTRCKEPIVDEQPALWKTKKVCQRCWYKFKYESKEPLRDKRKKERLRFKEPWMRLVAKDDKVKV